MSCEGIFQTEKDSGQIEDVNAKAEDSETYFQINLNYKCADICHDVVFNNQDVSSPLINIPNLRLIATNSPEQENSDCKTAELLVQDTGNSSTDAWLKSNVANDIDGLLKAESTESGSRLGTQSNNTVLADLTLKKYVVTTSSDGNLAFDLLTDLPENAAVPTNSRSNSDRILTLAEYEAGSVTTLLERGDDLEQDTQSVADRKKCGSDSDNPAVQIVALSLSDTASECSGDSLAKEKSLAKDLHCKVSFQDVLRDKLECQNGLLSRKYGAEIDTTKDIEDLTEFNLFAFPVDSIFQIDATEDVNNLNVSSDHEEYEEITLEKPETPTAIPLPTDRCKAQPVTIFTSSLPSNGASNTLIKETDNLDSVESEENVVAYSGTIDESRDLKSYGHATVPSHRMLSEGVNFPGKKTVVAISTDNTKNTADIPVVIDTSCEGQIFAGKTAKFLDVVTLWNTTTEKANDSVQFKESTSGHASNEEYSVQCSTEVGNRSAGVKTSRKPAQNEDSRPGDHVVEQALAEVGISVEDLSPITTENDQKLWVCPVKSCNKIFPRLCMLRTHILCHYGIRPYKCDYQGCEWSFYTYFKLKRHKETHLKKKDFVCPVDGCGRRFTTIYNLNTHVKLHERPAVMVCPVESCGARFQTKRSMEVHMRTHDSLHAPYKCPFEGCGKLYYSSNCLHSHSRVHLHKEEELRCRWEGCGKLFDQPCRLKAHMRIHTGVKPYKCTFKDCSWAFESASKLKRHQYKHTNERKYHCMLDGCGKSFLRSEHLKEHTLTHMPERTFKCPVENCGQKFSAKSSLYVHSKKHNASKGDQQAKATFSCPIEKCNRSYSMKSSLRQHMLKIHTPVLAQDTSRLEYITLLTANDDSGSLEGLEMLSEDGQLTSPGGDTSVKGLNILPASSTLITAEGQNILPASSTLITAEGQSDINDLMKKDFGSKAEETMPQFLLTPTETEITVASTQGVQDDSGTEVISDTCFIVTAGSMPAPLTEETVVTSEFPEETSCQGSARTDFTYEDVCTWKKQSMNLEEGAASSPNNSPMKQSLNPEVCASDPELPQIVLQDETLITQVDTDEDNLMTISNTFGEFQVLLLGQQCNAKQFSESTINLRDLQ